MKERFPADFEFAKKWNSMRTGWEILPDGESSQISSLLSEKQIKERFRRREAARTSNVFDFSEKAKRNPHVELPLGMIWPKREDEDNSIAIDIEATVTK